MERLNHTFVLFFSFFFLGVCCAVSREFDAGC